MASESVRNREVIQRRIGYLDARLSERPNDRNMIDERRALAWLMEREVRVQELVVAFEMVFGLVSQPDGLGSIRRICREVLRLDAQEPKP